MLSMPTWNNPEARRAYMREYWRRRRQDPEWVEKERARDRARYHTAGRVFNKPPETMTAIAANQHAKKVGVSGRLTAGDIRDLWARQPACVSCGRGRGVDHIRAMSRGGTNTPDNIQTMCRSCNAKKYWRSDRHVEREVA